MSKNQGKKNKQENLEPKTPFEKAIEETADLSAPQDEPSMVLSEREMSAEDEAEHKFHEDRMAAHEIAKRDFENFPQRMSEREHTENVSDEVIAVGDIIERIGNTSEGSEERNKVIVDAEMLSAKLEDIEISNKPMTEKEVEEKLKEAADISEKENKEEEELQKAEALEQKNKDKQTLIENIAEQKHITPEEVKSWEGESERPVEVPQYPNGKSPYDQEAPRMMPKK